MTMEDLWKKRSLLQREKMLKYAKYILNDHFVIVCIFLVGAMGYTYSEYLRTVAPEMIYGRVIAVLIFTGIIFIGKLATFIETADAVFLLPKEHLLERYMYRAERHSLYLPVVLFFLAATVLMPLLVITSPIVFLDLPLFVIYLGIMKDLELKVQHQKLKLISLKKRAKWTLLAVFCSFSGSLLTIAVSPFAGIAMALLLQWLFRKKWMNRFSADNYQWEHMINKEEKRIRRIYQFINLFTDIPALKSSVKRRSYLDFLFKLIPAEHKRTFTYLYARAFLRGTEYSGLYLRLLIVGILLISFVNSFVLSIVLMVLILYLTGFQLLTLYFHFDNIALTILYPIKQTLKLRSFEQVIFAALALECLLLSAAALAGFSSIENLALLSAGMMFNIFFSLIYLPGRISKMKKNRPY